MRIAVTDANIFIDLIKLQWLGHLFRIDLEIYTTLEVVNELKDTQQLLLEEFKEAGKLSVYFFDAAELEQIAVMEAPKALSAIDRSLVFLAKHIGAGVLSGDNPLRKYCSNCALEVRGILWLFDTLLDRGLVDHSMAIEKLNQLLSFNDRLPKEECRHRLREWGDRV